MSEYAMSEHYVMPEHLDKKRERLQGNTLVVFNLLESRRNQRLTDEDISTATGLKWTTVKKCLELLYRYYMIDACRNPNIRIVCPHCGEVIKESRTTVYFRAPLLKERLEERKNASTTW